MAMIMDQHDKTSFRESPCKSFQAVLLHSGIAVRHRNCRGGTFGPGNEQPTAQRHAALDLELDIPSVRHRHLLFSLCLFGQCGHDSTGGDDRVGEGRTVELGRARFFSTESRGRIFDEGDVIAEFHSKTAGRLDAGVRQHADEDDLFDSVLFKLLVEVSVSKAALRPVLLDDDVSLLREKVRMPLTAPSTLREDLVLSPGKLPGSRVLPMGIVARFPAMMRNDKDLDT